MNIMGKKVLLAGCVSAALLAIATGTLREKRDTGFYQEEVAPTADYYSPQEVDYNNYYNYQPQQRPVRRRGNGPFSWFTNIFGGNRREGGYSGSSGSSGYSGGGGGGYGGGHGKPAAGGGGFNLANIALPAILLIGGLILGGIALAALVNSLNNSGRGLDSDEWEVNHSVWMDQLQKDFEDSWSTDE